jgi:uncharacterized protein YggL (DUF469 family)
MNILDNNIAEASKKRQSTAMVSQNFKALRYVLEIQYAKIIKDWKIDGKLLHFINSFMKNQTLRVAIETHYRKKQKSKSESSR